LSAAHQFAYNKRIHFSRMWLEVYRNLGFRGDENTSILRDERTRNPLLLNGSISRAMIPRFPETILGFRDKRKVARILREARRKSRERILRAIERRRGKVKGETYLFPKRSLQNSAASALVMRNWSPANTPLGNIALSSDNMWLKTRLSLVRLRR